MEKSPFKIIAKKPEIRKQIMAEVMCGGGKVALEVKGGEIRIAPGTDRKNLLALTAVCKGLKDEAYAVFFSGNTFMLRVGAFYEYKVREGSNAGQEAFEIRQRLWTTAFKRWYERVESKGTTLLEMVELDLGSWHQDIPQHNDGIVASSIGKLIKAIMPLAHIPEFLLTHFNAIIRIGIPTAGPTPCVEEVQIPITDSAKAKEIVNNLFDDKLAQLDRLWSQQKVTSIAYRTLKRDTLFCKQRLERFIQVASSAPPKWTPKDTEELGTLINKNTKRRSRHLNPLQLLPARKDHPLSANMTKRKSKGNANANANTEVIINKTVEFKVERPPPTRQHAILPPPIALRDRQFPSQKAPLSELVFQDGETVTTITGPRTPHDREQPPTQRYARDEMTIKRADPGPRQREEAKQRSEEAKQRNDAGKWAMMNGGHGANLALPGPEKKRK